MSRLPLLLSTAALLSAGCVINDGRHQRPRDLAPEWRIDRPRLLAVRAEPAEPRPGDLVRFDALLLDPTQTIESVLWLACPTDGDGVGFGCVDAEQEPELIGLQPLLQPSLTVPGDLLDGLDDRERHAGRYLLVQVTGLPELEVAPGEQPELDPDAIDFNSIESGYKRVVVSDTPTPNRNPRVRSFTVEGEPIPDGAVLEVDAGEPYRIGLFLTDASIETYEYVTRDGEVELRTEQPFVSWYTDAGELLEPATLYPFLQSSWIAPETTGDATIWAVVRDRRGGFDWARLDVRVR